MHIYIYMYIINPFYKNKLKNKFKKKVIYFFTQFKILIDHHFKEICIIVLYFVPMFYPTLQVMSFSQYNCARLIYFTFINIGKNSMMYSLV